MSLAEQLGSKDLDIIDELRALRLTLENLERNVMYDFDQMKTEMEAQGGMLSELATVVASIHDHVTDQHEGKIISPATQEKIDGAMETLKTNRDKLEAALAKVKSTMTMTVPPPAVEAPPVEAPHVEATAVVVDPITGVPV